MPVSPVTVLLQELAEGTRVSSPVAIPAGTAMIQATGVMANADAANPANTCTINMSGSADQLRWAPIVSGSWQGQTDPTTGLGVPPGFSSGLPQPNPPSYLQFQAQVGAGQLYPLGLAISFFDANGNLL